VAGARARIQQLGLRHGLYCVGCCWALMLVMFVVGIGRMLVLGTVIALEKNHPIGARLSTPLGIALLAWASVIVIEHLAGR
jgi:predicted metal-binding membrane protein